MSRVFVIIFFALAALFFVVPLCGYGIFAPVSGKLSLLAWFQKAIDFWLYLQPSYEKADERGFLRSLLWFCWAIIWFIIASAIFIVKLALTIYQGVPVNLGTKIRQKILAWRLRRATARLDAAEEVLTPLPFTAEEG